MNKNPPTPLRIFAMVGFAFSCFGLLLFLWLSFGGPVPLKPKGYRVQIGFQEATQLAAQADVRVSGVSVGKVVSKRRDPSSNRTLATIQLDRKYAPLHSDARATLRQKTLLGETFVELTLGSPSAPPVPESGRLANDRLQPVGRDRRGARHLRSRSRAARSGSGSSSSARRSPAAARTSTTPSATLPQFVDSGGDLFEVLDENRQSLGQLVRDTGVVFGALTEREDQLKRLVTAQDDVFSAIAGRARGVRRHVAHVPDLPRRVQGDVRAPAHLLARRPSRWCATSSPRSTTCARRSTRSATSAPTCGDLFVNLDPLLTISRRSLPATTEVLDGLRPLLGELGPFLGELNPLLNYIGVHVYTLSDMFANLGVATAAKVKDPTPGANGHYLRQFGPLGPDALAIMPDALVGQPRQRLPQPARRAHLTGRARSTRSCRRSTATTPSPTRSRRRPPRAAASSSRSSSTGPPRATRACTPRPYDD